MTEPELYDKLAAEWREADLNATHPDKTLGQYLSRRMKEIDAKRLSIRGYRSKMATMEANYRGAVKLVEDEIAAAQSTCKHELTTHHSDPSGGSDSWTECQICGASV